MSIEDIIRAWKSDEDALTLHLPASPVGRELSEQELLEVTGGTCDTPETGACDPSTCLSTICSNSRPVHTHLLTDN